jgi:hypothetical protein
MGLERLSIIFELEQRLDIKLPDDAIGARTVGDLEAFVRAATPPEESCLGAAAFYRIRRGFVAAGVPRSKVRPSASVALLLPPGRALRRVWKKIRAHQRGLPPLAPRGKLDAVMCFLSGVASFAIFMATVILAEGTGLDFAASCAAGLIAFGVTIAFLPRDSWAPGERLPHGIETVRDLVRSVAPVSLLDLVCVVIAEECAVEFGEVTRETDLHRDLGI